MAVPASPCALQTAVNFTLPVCECRVPASPSCLVVLLLVLVCGVKGSFMVPQQRLVSRRAAAKPGGSKQSLVLRHTSLLCAAGRAFRSAFARALA